ncbi:MAG: hypothetical protein ACOCRU_01790, partial [bacterium]
GPLEEDAYKVLDNGIKDGRLIVKNLNNNTDLEGTIELYAIENNPENLYSEGVVIAKTEIKARHEDDYAFGLSVEDAKILSKENTYVGLRVRIDGDKKNPISYQLRWGDSISFEDINLLITARVNQ